jgi:hypothetical protein
MPVRQFGDFAVESPSAINPLYDGTMDVFAVHLRFIEAAV